MAACWHLRIGLVLLAGTFGDGQNIQAPIQNLATDATGSMLYFTTWLRQRGTTQSAVSKVFSLFGTQLQLVQQSSYNSLVAGTPFYARPSVSGDGTILAINWNDYCFGGSECLLQDTNSTVIHTPTGTLSYPGQANLSPNGRFALLFGVAAGPLAILPPQPVEVELADLTTGKITVIGQQPAGSGQVVANDGTAVVETASVVQVVGPQGAVTIAPSYSINTLQIAADASRIVYDTYEANAGIRVLDLSSGVDSPLTAGNFPKLANDGHRFTYLNATGLNTGGQVWLGDAFSGALEALTNEPEGIADQTITGDGSTVFAATNSGRVLAIDVASGAVTQLLDSAPPQFLALYSTPVPGSYNWVSGTSDTSLQVRLGGVPAIELGADPAASELVIQVPWEVQPDPAASIVVWGKEPAWEQVIGTGVSALAGTSVMLDALGDSAIHQDWSRLVTFNDPAQPGEIIHTYGTGWGPVDGAVPSGQPTPAGRLYTITAPCQWQAIGNPLQAAEPFAALFAGLAPGLIGLYQLDFLIPMHWAYRTFTPECVIPGSNPNILAAVPMAP